MLLPPHFTLVPSREENQAGGAEHKWRSNLLAGGAGHLHVGGGHVWQANPTNPLPQSLLFTPGAGGGREEACQTGGGAPHPGRAAVNWPRLSWRGLAAAQPPRPRSERASDVASCHTESAGSPRRRRRQHAFIRRETASPGEASPALREWPFHAPRDELMPCHSSKHQREEGRALTPAFYVS